MAQIEVTDILCASPGKYRTIVFGESEMYQVGTDQETFEDASALGDELRKLGQNVQVFDDLGRYLIN